MRSPGQRYVYGVFELLTQRNGQKAIKQIEEKVCYSSTFLGKAFDVCFSHSPC
jgi:hypothetical protein